MSNLSNLPNYAWAIKYAYFKPILFKPEYCEHCGWMKRYHDEGSGWKCCEPGIYREASEGACRNGQAEIS